MKEQDFDKYMDTKVTANTTSTEIANIITEKEKSLKESLFNLSTVLQESHKIAKQILILRTEKKDLEMNIDKCKHNIAQTKLDLKMLQDKFWSCRHSGC